VKSDNSNYDARPLTLGEYASFAVALLRGTNETTVDKSRFSFFDIYRQFCLNYDRISGFAALFVLVYATIRNVPSLTNLALIFSITLILTQFETRTHRNKMKRMFKNGITCGYQFIDCSLYRTFVVVGQYRCSPLIVCVYHHAVSYFGPRQYPLGSHHYIRYYNHEAPSPLTPAFVCACGYYSSLELRRLTALQVLTIFPVGFGYSCPLPTRQVALLGISLIATIVYLRWKDLQGTEISERGQIEKSVCNCFSTSENVTDAAACRSSI